MLSNQVNATDCAELPKTIYKGVLILEDKRFFTHSGFDFYAILRAIKINLTKKSILQGASTIEQQLVRIITNEKEINFGRKFKEIILATLISEKYEKIKLLKCYCNIYPFDNCIGIGELCQVNRYDLNSLSIYNVSEIVARIKYPVITKKNYIRYLKRVRKVQIKLELC